MWLEMSWVGAKLISTDTCPHTSLQGSFTSCRGICVTLMSRAATQLCLKSWKYFKVVYQTKNSWKNAMQVLFSCVFFPTVKKWREKKASANYWRLIIFKQRQKHFCIIKVYISAVLTNFQREKEKKERKRKVQQGGLCVITFKKIKNGEMWRESQDEQTQVVCLGTLN